MITLQLERTADLSILAEALAMAASRHEAMGHVTKGAFRYSHDEKAKRMRELRLHVTMADRSCK